MKSFNLFSILAIMGVLSFTQLQAASVFIGDAADQGISVTDQETPDASNAGALTYVFTNSGLTNTTGDTVTLSIDRINFWSENGSGTVIPFFAIYTGANVALATNYNVVAIGTPISAATAGLHNASYSAALGDTTITLAAGETLVAGFFQDSSVVPYLSTAGDADYVFNNSAESPGSEGSGNTLPSSVPETLTDNASYSSLSRTYAYNAEISVIPEPGAAALIALSGLGLLRRRR